MAALLRTRGGSSSRFPHGSSHRWQRPRTGARVPLDHRQSCFLRDSVSIVVVALALERTLIQHK